MAKKLNKKLMHFPPDMKRQSLSFEIPPSKYKTVVNVEVEIYQGEGSSLMQMQPLLGDGMMPYVNSHPGA